MEAEVAEPVIDRLMGHEVKGSEGAKVYNHAKQVLRRALERVRYPALSLPRVTSAVAQDQEQSQSARRQLDVEA